MLPAIGVLIEDLRGDARDFKLDLASTGGAFRFVPCKGSSFPASTLASQIETSSGSSPRNTIFPVRLLTVDSRSLLIFLISFNSTSSCDLSFQLCSRSKSRRSCGCNRPYDGSASHHHHHQKLYRSPSLRPANTLFAFYVLIIY